MLLCKHYFSIFDLGQNLTLETFQPYWQFFGKPNIFGPNNCFSRNLKHHWKSREEKESFRTFQVKKFWNLTMTYYRLDLRQVKRILISSITNLVYGLPREFPNDLRLDLRKLGNIRKISNLGGDIV